MGKDLPCDKHAEFAREVVALARKHQMNALSLSFRASFTLSREPIYSGMVSASWSEGRHGSKNPITLRFDGSMTISEQATDEPYSPITFSGEPTPK